MRNKKTILIIGFIVLIGAIFAYGYFFNYSEKNYSRDLKEILTDYADASYLLAAIVNVNIEEVEFDTWLKWTEKNQKEWQAIEIKSKTIIKYLETGPPEIDFIQEDEFGFLQKTMKEKIAFFSTSNVLAQEINKEITRELLEKVHLMVEGAPRKGKLPIIMRELNVSARQAMELYEEANKMEFKDSIKSAERWEMASVIAEKTKDISFLTVAAG
ncbi:hypothetical protein K8R66_02565, partial [bacterium]|nr:hypothetical protein [bacterium]